ncbi:MAG: MOSC domain-containing protein [Betaproteobacteria bacterium]|nr:MOSC domain-containing protein [Betaproteobacteria bacterium]
MQKVGTIREIWRYPVKGMAGEQLEASPIGPNGVQGDRTWALRDTRRAEIQSCKFRPQLLRCSARANDDGRTVSVTFPDGATLRSDDDAIHARLSALTGHESTLEPLRPESDTAFYRRHKPERGSWLDELATTFDREPGEPLPDFTHIPPVLVDHVTVPGTFFLVVPMHVVTTATLRHLQSLNGGGSWDRRRFRPNLVIETDPAISGLAEQEWVGRKMVIGDILIECVGGTPRCGAVTRAQPGFGPDTSILRTIVREADQNVGAYGLVVQPGSVRTGDAVYLD